jgi:anti-sigma factor RsiW
MNDLERVLLQEYVDGSLPAGRTADVERLLERSVVARRFVEEHRALWDALGEAFPEDEEAAGPSPEFRARTVEAAGHAEPSRVRWGLVAGVAAAALVTIAVSLWMRGDTSPLRGIPAADREVVRYLHVLRELETLEALGVELDLRGDLEVYRAFSGELEGEG